MSRIKTSNRLYRTWLYSVGPTVNTKSQAKKHRKKFKVTGLPARKKVSNWRPPSKKKTLEDRAKYLRENPSLTERTLRDALVIKAKANPRYRFLFNCAQGPFIPDFCFLNSTLIVECDGASHATENAKVHDARRDDYFKERGFLTLRFHNSRVLSDLDSVVGEILRTVESRFEAKRQMRELPRHVSREATSGPSRESGAGFP